MAIAPLHLQHLLEHIRRRPTGHILIHTHQPIRLGQRLPNAVVNIKREQGLHVNHLHLNADSVEVFGRVHCQLAHRPIGDERHIRPLAQHFGHTQRNRNVGQVFGEPLFFAVAIQHFHNQAGVIPLEQGVVKTDRTGHVAGNQHMDAAQHVDDATHGRPRVPHPFQPVSTGADNDGRFLPPPRAPTHRRQIIRHDLQGVQNVIEVLDFGDGAQAAHGHANRLSHNRRLADARVADAQVAVFGLQTRHRLVHIP